MRDYEIGQMMPGAGDIRDWLENETDTELTIEEANAFRDWLIAEMADEDETE